LLFLLTNFAVGALHPTIYPTSRRNVMDEPSDPDREAVQRLMRQLHGYAEGLGLDDATTRQIVEHVIADLPNADDVHRQAEARQWMLLAAR
jgi:hypothetical protein